MNQMLSKAPKALALVFAVASFSFAGPGLADGAAKFVGNITQSNNSPGANDQFTQLWNQATAENGCKWGSVEGTRGRYNWAGCDAAYNWAKNNGGHFKFHALVWGSQYPNWLPGLSVDETKKAITAWFDAVKDHYPDIEMIDVVNEAIRGGNGNYHSGYNNTKIIQALGGDNGDYAFITTAFKMARDRWPNAILIYNDYNTIQWDVDGGINLVNTIKKNGAPIDGYGLQAHDLMTNGGNGGGTGGGGDCMNYNTFTSTMEKIHSKTNNIPIFISEYDVPSTDDGIQKQCVSEQFKYWMEDPHVAGITFWGYIYGQTWLDCNGKANGCSGLIRNGQDRTAMTWLKDYLSKNKGVNETGLPTGDVTPVPPEPQLPFKGEAFAIPGKIQAEDFDIPGKGKNEDGTSNQSYGDDSENHGDSDYRKDTGVDLYKKSGDRIVVGYNQTGDWLEYTINVSEAGDYTFFAAVASANNTSSFQMSLDGNALTDKISVPKASSGEENYDDYNKVSANVTLPSGKHILRMDVTGDWFDIDYFTFVKGKDATDPEPITPDPQFVQPNLQFDNTLQHYFVIDPMGVRMGVISGYGFEAAGEMLRESPRVTASGIYYLKNRKTGQMYKVRVVR
ncbi:endo-1,4-beta-xylanase [Fibrobacter sp. UWP2]|uniref:endo-1,4-beta-xylanase n=1 Tax=Fibrobacter sp. UWP2 TaxID=1896216 RepID=UPI000910C2B0|nr:endo-1,4-beta-xylanase [Fibrobacter sp. UWP2]SHJ25344.1 Endo-1,4-beta-xylanase, GH35 family [Fibrobacter sp. UWP2]